MEWIDINKEKPKQLRMVLVATNTGLIPTMAYRFKETDWFYYSICSGNFSLSTQPHIKISHWMPLPELPKKAETPPVIENES
jgi:hypothetical protein